MKTAEEFARACFFEPLEEIPPEHWFDVMKAYAEYCITAQRNTQQTAPKK
jgi:hypothetical protein